VNLGDYFSLYQYAGYEIEAVEVYSQVYGNSMELSLVADRTIEDTAGAYEGYSSTLLYPRRTLVIHSNTFDVELMARGQGEVRLDQVILRVSRY
jgi:hypothetical protein